ncbi:sulfurtransferase [Sulfurimonas sp. SAG-AH-194-C21]|nr:rhodanese-like domain-containing protein [Sulfurimonas sp. SAG-AH-194-C21]MDF1884191.1 sulfurtransferase [Sulfurimonas sp. SAG-AH-194-C21]
MKFLLFSLFTFLSLYASEAFIDVTELKSKVENKNIVILDTTDKKTYDKGHIPGAVLVNISNFRHPVEKYQLINSPMQLQKEFRSLGINNNSEVIIYGHNKGKELLKASYVALSLISHGLQNVSILNGGYPEWVSEYEFDELIQTKTPEYKKGNFVVKPNKKIIIDIDYVKSRIGTTPMIEARPLKYFNGTVQSNGVKRLGHISGAKSSYWRDKFDSEYKLKPINKIKKIFIKSNKLNVNKEVITYCTGGLEASMNWYILHAYLHFKDVKIYDASMKQWGNLDKTPMQK